MHHSESIELAHVLNNRGNNVIILSCRGELISCAANPKHEKYLCFRCNLQSDYSQANLLPREVKNLTLQLSGELEEDSNIVFANLTDFTNYEFMNVPIGRMALSQLVDDYLDIYLPLSLINTKGVQLIQLGKKLYLESIRLLRSEKIDEIYVWNGRRVSEGPILYAAKSLGIRHYSYISGSDPTKYSLIEGLGIHSLAAISREIQNVHDKLIGSKEKKNLLASAELFFELQEFGTQRALGALTFNEGKSYTSTPVFKDTGLIKLAIFTSSFWEWIGNPEHTSVPLDFKDPYKVVEQIVMSEQLKGRVEIVIRWHPNLRMAGKSERDRMMEISKIPHPNITHIFPESEQSSYQILDESDVVLSNGSTISVEASFRGRPSISAGFSVYRGTGATHEPESMDELVDLILSKPKAVGFLEAVAYGAWHYSQGEKYRFVTFDEIKKEYHYKSIPINVSKPTLFQDRTFLRFWFLMKNVLLKRLDLHAIRYSLKSKMIAGMKRGLRHSINFILSNMKLN